MHKSLSPLHVSHVFLHLSNIGAFTEIAS